MSEANMTFTKIVTNSRLLRKLSVCVWWWGGHDKVEKYQEAVQKRKITPSIVS